MTLVAKKAAAQVAINDIGSAEDFLAAVEKTLKFFNDGDLIEGTVVKVDRDEVLLDVGYKTEGVIPSRELSIKHDIDPSEVVKVGDTVIFSKYGGTRNRLYVVHTRVTRAFQPSEKGSGWSSR